MQIEHSCKNIKIGPTHPKGAVWCPKCLHYTLLDPQGRCECCLFRLGNKPKSYPNLLQFEKIVNANNSAILAYSESNCPDELQFYWPVQVGIQKYLIPVKEFVKYLKLNDIEQTKRFLESIKKNSIVLPRYIQAVK